MSLSRGLRPSWTLRSLLLVPVVLSPVFWYASTVVRGYEREQQALSEMAGIVDAVVSTSTTPSWLRELGIEPGYFSRVSAVNLWGAARDVYKVDHLRRLHCINDVSVHDPVTLSIEARPDLLRSHYPFVESAVRIAVRKPTLRRLHVRFTGIDNSMIETIAEASSLRELLLWRASDPPCSVEALARVHGLESLSLHHFWVPTRASAALAQLTTLQALDLSDCELTDKALERISLLPRLRRLNLTNCAVTDLGVDALAQVTSLEWLSLAGCGITDRALHSIGQSGLQHALRTLYLDGTHVTDCGVDSLRGCDTLEDLSLRETNVTAASLMVLASLPKLARNVDLKDTYADGDGTPCLDAFVAGASVEKLQAMYNATQPQRMGTDVGQTREND